MSKRTKVKIRNTFRGIKQTMRELGRGASYAINR